jgi:hypothetical protein
LLTVAAAASMAGIANAVPFGPNDIPPGLTNQGGSPPGLANQGGSPSGLIGQGGLSSGSNTPFVAVNSPVSAVPEGGTSLLFLGAGLIALVLWRRGVILTSHN